LTWKLAGVNYGVELVSQTPGGPLYAAALYDARGYYDGVQPIDGPDPVPLGSAATRISSRIGFINSVTGVPEPGTWALTLAVSLPAAVAAWRRQKSTESVPVN